MPYEGLAKSTPSGPRWTGKIRLVPEALEQPLRWRKPRRVFVNSMSDLFHKDVPDGFILDVWRIMAQTSQHTYQILTKRPKRMLEWMRYWRGHGREDVLSNVCLGVSVEDQATANNRIPLLLACPAAVRFISAEPLLAPIDFESYPSTACPTGWLDEHPNMIDQIIVGGEAGPGSRPMHPAWARSIRDQCVRNNVSYFFKQWGDWIDHRDVAHDDCSKCVWLNEKGRQFTERKRRSFTSQLVVMRRVGKKKAGRVLDGRIWDESPVLASGSDVTTS